MAKDSVTGKAGGFTLAGAALVFTKWTAKTKKEMAKTTDSSSYNAATGQLFTTQLPGEVSQEVTVEGHWSRASTPSGLIALLNLDPVVACSLKIDQSTTYCSGNYDLSDVDMSLQVEGAETVDFTATLMSNGPISYGS